MYVLNYTTLVQISENGYPFFIIMLRVAWWMRRSWLIISKSLEGPSRVSSEPSSVCANGWNASPQNTPKPILPSHRTPKWTLRSDLTSCGRYNPDSWRNAMNIANSTEVLSGFQLRWLNRVMQDHEARASDLNRKLIFSFFLLFS